MLRSWRYRSIVSSVPRVFLYGVVVKSLHANNGIYAKMVFTDKVAGYGQTTTFCGVGGYHQNGVLENCIGRLTSRSSRTNLPHALIRWSDIVREILGHSLGRIMNSNIMIFIETRDTSHLYINTIKCICLSILEIIIPLVVQCICYRVSCKPVDTRC